jgi:hypothetical protein
MLIFFDLVAQLSLYEEEDADGFDIELKPRARHLAESSRTLPYEVEYIHYDDQVAGLLQPSPLARLFHFFACIFRYQRLP